MCGFVGIFDPSAQRPVSDALLRDMSEAVAHRGPDDCGSFLAPGVGMRHHRLALVDSAGGKQPMCSPDERLVVAFNGYIYNFLELRSSLEALGASFRTRSDTEVVVQAWVHWGPECVKRFRGMFALAVWDRAERSLCLVRDPLGIKPLVYAHLPDGTVAFASDLRAFFRIPSFRREILPTSIEDYLAFGYVPEPATLFRDVMKLPAGSTLTLRQEEPLATPVFYWRPWVSGAGPRLSPSNMEGELLEALGPVVRNCLTLDRRIGVLLSGGVDSSAVLWAAASAVGESIPAFTLAVEHDGYDESRFAAVAARHCGAAHRLVPFKEPDERAIDQLAVAFDEPFADSSALPTTLICQQAKTEVSVVLSGDGGDELFAGYRRYREVPRGNGAGNGTAGSLIDRYMDRISIVPASLRERLYRRDFGRSLQGYTATEVLRRSAEDAPAKDEVELLQYLDLRTYLQGDILTKVDRMSMAHALEVRVPMLDHTFVDLASTLPTQARIRGSEGKWILKKALEGHLPEGLLYRPKMGFSVPIDRWLTGHLRDHARQRLTTSTLIEAGVLDRDAIADLLDEPGDACETVWSLLMLDGYCREYVHS